MTGYPHRYGTSRAAAEHYATACVASAAILRREGQLEQARDLEDAAHHAREHGTAPAELAAAPEAEVPAWWH